MSGNQRDLELKTNLYRARRTILQMLRDRNYIIPNHKLEMTHQDYIDTYKDS